MIEADDDQLDRVRIGTPVSIDARSVKRDDEADLRIRRHSLVRLNAVAILARGELPYYEAARIIDVRELPVRVAAPALDLGGYVLRPGDELIDHIRGTVHRYEAGVLVPQ